jgi:cytochrome c peroxidase
MGKYKQLTLLAFILAFALIPILGNAQVPDPEEERPLASLKTVPVPEPVNLAEFVKDKAAAIRLGKALFWDMQVGSDGLTACASCHFHAGADNRTKNQISPGLLGADSRFEIGGPNAKLLVSHFPTTQFLIPDRPGAEIDPGNLLIRSNNDVVSSQGVKKARFTGIVPGSGKDSGVTEDDPVFSKVSRGRWINQRRVEPRNAPSVINSVFNFSNFWDGRARNIFNGVNPFGELDENARVYVNDPVSGLTPVQVRIPDASLASQAVGPPLSDFEMSFAGRTFPELGRKMLSFRPLSKQVVHPQDSVLGPFASKAPRKGLNTTYTAMIQAAFQDRWWNNTTQVVSFPSLASSFALPGPGDPRSFSLNPGPSTIRSNAGAQLDANAQGFSQMEANFSLFFGLAIQLYEATLVSDDSKFDRVMEGVATFTPDEQAGFNIFMNQGRCNACHSGAEFTNHAVDNIRNLGGAPSQPVFPFAPIAAIERMNVANRSNVIYDSGIYNIAVVPAGGPGELPPGVENEDIGRGGTAPFINPLTGQPYPLSFSELAKLKAQNLLPPGVAQFVPDLPSGASVENPVAINGSQKAPGLRNVELTGPFFHDGSAATLRQVVEFYTRGGNFPVTNAFNLDLDIAPIGNLAGNPERQNQLVAFLLTLTDERVRNEMAPFDHPQLIIPHGSSDLFPNRDETIILPAVGAGGRPAAGLPPLQPFLGLDQTQPDLTFAITGTISSGGLPLAGIIINATGPQNISAVTNEDGFYSLAGLSNGTYTVTPLPVAFDFMPTNRTLTIAGAHILNQDFTGAPVPTFSISGTITSGGVPLAGVTVMAEGIVTVTAVTNEAGVYALTGLANGSYQVSALSSGFRFFPFRRNVTVSGADLTGVNFTGLRLFGGI